ncbi:MAG: hypothetical protein Q8929_10725 [Bacillota bacterium]|nr:hypothetical protein [Bacillota bacterium]
MSFKKEGGYALVTVLLVITIFIIVGVSAIGLSFNTVKQNQVIETKSQSTSVAEMGMTYYQAMIKNIYFANQQSINDSVRQGPKLTSNSAYAQSAANQMMSAVRAIIESQTTPVYIDGKTDAYFRIKTPTTFDTTNNKITLRVEGIDKDKTTTLSTDITFAPIASGGDQSSGGSPLVALYSSDGVQISPNYIHRPSVNILCQTPLTLDLLNSVCNNTALILGASTYTQNVNNLLNKTYYATGALTINKNANKMTGVNIHSEDSLTVGGNMNQGSGNVFETVHDATFGGQLRLDLSKMFVGGNLTISDHFDLANHSTAYVAGNATIAKSLTVDSTSTLCVAGILTVSGIVKSTGSITNVILSSDPDFQTKCGAPSTSTVNITWGTQLFNNINYEY